VKKKFHPLKTGEVICVANPVQFVSPHNTFRVSELAEALKQELIKYSSYGVSEEDLGWLSSEGSDCAVLQFGAPGWEKGKLRIKIEFCPDDTEADYTDYGDDEEELVVAAKSTNTDKIQPQALVSTTSTYSNSHKNPFDDVASGLDSENFSLEPDLDFIAESATVLELNRPAGISGNMVDQDNQDDDINEMLSQSIEDELNSVSESEDDSFPESLDDDDNFGFGELDLDEDSEGNNSSDFDSVWQDL
jgi:hypothetical protein